MSLCGTEELEPAAAPVWPLLEGLALWSVELGEDELDEDELDGEVDWEEEVEGEVELWSDCGIVEVELLLEDGLELLLGLADDELLEGEVLCELLEAEGAELLWSDCGIVEVELLLEGDVLLEGEALWELEVDELLLPTPELDWLLAAGLEDWSLLLLVLVLGAAELGAEDDGVWLLEAGGIWSDCGWADVGFCVVLCCADGVCVWSGKVLGVLGACVVVLWASAKPALIASTIPNLYRFFFMR
jgi:hypothetical protein